MAWRSQCAIRGTLGLACLVWPRAALCQDAPVHDQGIVLDGWLGGGSTSVVKEAGAAGTVGIGVTGLYYWQWLELGLGYTLEGAIFAFSAQVPGVLAGAKIDPVPWLRFDLLGEGGAYVVSGVGGGLFATALSGDQASLPYLGGKVGISFLPGSAHRFLLGWWVNAGEAVGQRTMYPLVKSCVFGCSVTEETFTFGGASWSMGLRLGGDISQW